MSKNRQIVRMMKPWAEKVGYGKALGRLVDRGFRVRHVEELFSGKYDHELRDTSAIIILEEMAKDGFTLPEGEVA